MSWIDQLSEDLHLWSMRTDLSERERRIMHAARLVVEGEDIWWCGEHRAVGVTGYEMCAVAWGWVPETPPVDRVKPCRMVLRRMIDIPEEEK